MLQLKKILYPTDFSELSIGAVSYVQEFSRLFNAEVHCLHVVDEAYQYWMGAGETAVPMVIPSEDLKKTAEPQLDEFVKKHFSIVTKQSCYPQNKGKSYQQSKDYD